MSNGAPRTARYLRRTHVTCPGIDSTTGTGPEVRNHADDTLGRLCGFLVDPLSRKLTHLVVREDAPGPGHRRIIPLGVTMVDREQHVVRVLDDLEVIGATSPGPRQACDSDDSQSGRSGSVRRPTPTGTGDHR